MTTSQQTNRFLATIYKIWMIHYVDVPKEVGLTLAKQFAAKSHRSGKKALPKHIPVVAISNNRSTRTTLVPGGAGRYRLQVNSTLRNAAHAGAGEVIGVALALDLASRELSVPPELADALKARPRLKKEFERLTVAARRQFIRWYSAKSPEVRRAPAGSSAGARGDAPQARQTRARRMRLRHSLWLCRAGLLLLTAPLLALSQTRAPQESGPDRLGMSCAQILAMSSSDWIAKFNHEEGGAPEATVRAIHVYGQCYDARTDRLAASLARSGRGPLMGARGNFRDLEQAIKEFASAALAASNSSGDAVKLAYASLYQRQFRYEFYSSYQPKNPKAEPEPAKKPVTPAPPAGAAQPVTQPAEPPQVSEMTKAKNRFGELLDALPVDQMRDIHRAFGKIFAGGPVSDEMKLAIYRYAIFCLEPPIAPPFAPPPF